MRKNGENDEGYGGGKGAGGGVPPRLEKKKKEGRNPTGDASTASGAFNCSKNGLSVKSGESALAEKHAV